MDVSDDLPKSYDRQWKYGSKESAYCQHLTFVVFDPSSLALQPVGFARGGISLSIPDEEHDNFELSVFLDMFYVAPRFRGKGLGFDLSIAVGNCLSEFVDCVYEQLPAGATFSVRLEYESITEEGSRIGDYVTGLMEVLTDCYKDEQVDRPKKKRVAVELVIDGC